MTAKIKIIVGVLGLIALVSVISIVDRLGLGPRFSIIQNKSNISMAISDDADSDGLKNDDETYWNTDPFNPDTDNDGYKDGEEVLSGHDPLTPGPDDLINETNATKLMAKLTASGLAEGSLRSDNPDKDSAILNLTDSVINSIQFDNNRIFKITTTPTNKASQESYSRAMGEIVAKTIVGYNQEIEFIKKALVIINNEGFSNKELINNFDKFKNSYDDLLNKSSAMVVPIDWKDNHLFLLKILNGLFGASKAIAGGKDDPVKALAGFNYLISESANIITAIDNIVVQSKAAGLDINSN